MVSDLYTIIHNNPFLPDREQQAREAYDTSHQCILAAVCPDGEKVSNEGMMAETED